MVSFPSGRGQNGRILLKSRKGYLQGGIAVFTASLPNLQRVLLFFPSIRHGAESVSKNLFSLFCLPFAYLSTLRGKIFRHKDLNDSGLKYISGFSSALSITSSICALSLDSVPLNGK